jgi:hypothetical protein
MLKDDLISEKVVKAEVDKLQQQESSQKTTRILDLEKELEEMEDEFKTFINYLVEITSFLNKNHRVEVEDKIKQMEE